MENGVGKFLNKENLNFQKNIYWPGNKIFFCKFAFLKILQLQRLHLKKFQNNHRNK